MRNDLVAKAVLPVDRHGCPQKRGIHAGRQCTPKPEPPVRQSVYNPAGLPWHSLLALDSALTKSSPLLAPAAWVRCIVRPTPS